MHDPGSLGGLLDELSDRIRRVHTRVLVGGLPSLAEQARQGGTRTEPWVVAVLLGNRRALAEEDQRQLQRVLRGGPACGISAVLVDVPLTIAAAVETVRLKEAAEPGRVVATTSMTGPHVSVVARPVAAARRGHGGLPRHRRSSTSACARGSAPSTTCCRRSSGPNRRCPGCAPPSGSPRGYR